MIRVLEVPGLNLVPNTDCAHDFNGISRAVQAGVRIVS
jgi:hypothetical protein